MTSSQPSVNAARVTLPSTGCHMVVTVRLCDLIGQLSFKTISVGPVVNSHRNQQGLGWLLSSAYRSTDDILTRLGRKKILSCVVGNIRSAHSIRLRSGPIFLTGRASFFDRRSDVGEIEDTVCAHIPKLQKRAVDEAPDQQLSGGNIRRLKKDCIDANAGNHDKREMEYWKSDGAHHAHQNPD